MLSFSLLARFGNEEIDQIDYIALAIMVCFEFVRENDSRLSLQL